MKFNDYLRIIQNESETPKIDGPNLGKFFKERKNWKENARDFTWYVSFNFDNKDCRVSVSDSIINNGTKTAWEEISTKEGKELLEIDTKKGIGSLGWFYITRGKDPVEKVNNTTLTGVINKYF
jgi:hypothetical protein